MQLIGKFKKGFRFSLCIINIFSKYGWVVPLKDRKGVNSFQKILNDLKENQIKYGLIKQMNFITILLKND